jgi:putative nucleotidyltransferase with HDIG domain
MNPRILFVDDERQVLDGLQLRLRQQRKRWQMSFASSGAEALELLGAQAFDVVVSDMRMPVMDGAALLAKVRDRQPQVARLILSGYSNEEAVLRSLSVAHQFLPKPCDPGVLENAIDRTCALQALLRDEAVRKAVGRVSWLPSVPSVYLELTRAIADADVDLPSLGRIIARDAALSAALLHTANSAYFGLSRPIVRAEEAVIFLGLATLRNLVLFTEVFGKTRAGHALPGVELERLQQHSLLTAELAAGFFPAPGDRESRDAAFAAGLLHDVGKLLLADELPERAELVEDAVRAGELQAAAEERMYGVTHAEAGAYLLGLWQLPFRVVEAVAHHHRPSRAARPEGTADIVAAVHVANALALEELPGEQAAEGRGLSLEPGSAERLGLGAPGALEPWRERARKLAREGLA